MLSLIFSASVKWNNLHAKVCFQLLISIESVIDVNYGSLSFTVGAVHAFVGKFCKCCRFSLFMSFTGKSLHPEAFCRLSWRATAKINNEWISHE
ncbi:hypothetical protein D3C80_2073560 [compost metagenome]